MAKDEAKGGVTVDEGKAAEKPNPQQKPEAQTEKGDSIKPASPGETGTTPGTNWK